MNESLTEWRANYTKEELYEWHRQHKKSTGG